MLKEARMEGANVVYEGRGAPRPTVGQRIENWAKRRWTYEGRMESKYAEMAKELGGELTPEQKLQVAERIGAQVQKQVTGTIVKDAIKTAIVVTTVTVLGAKPELRASLFSKMGGATLKGGEWASKGLGAQAANLRGVDKPNFLRRGLASIIEGTQKVVEVTTTKGSEMFAAGTRGAFHQMRGHETKLRGAVRAAEETLAKKAGDEGLTKAVTAATEKQSAYTKKIAETAQKVKGDFAPLMQRVTTAHQERLASSLLRRGEKGIAESLKKAEENLPKVKEAAEQAYQKTISSLKGTAEEVTKATEVAVQARDKQIAAAQRAVFNAEWDKARYWTAESAKEIREVMSKDPSALQKQLESAKKTLADLAANVSDEQRKAAESRVNAAQKQVDLIHIAKQAKDLQDKGETAVHDALVQANSEVKALKLDIPGLPADEKKGWPKINTLSKDAKDAINKYYKALRDHQLLQGVLGKRV